MNTTRILARAAATVLVGATAAFGAPASASEAETELGGFDAQASAAPVAIWLFEPTLPTYSAPQAELDLGYTRVTAATGPSGRALASYAWPGPLVGDGFGLVTEGLGLPKTDYPAQANSDYPEGGETANEPAPGTRQSASTSESRMTARVGLASGDDAGGEDQGDGAGAATGLGLDKTAGKNQRAAEPSPLDALVTAESMDSVSDVLLGPDLVTAKAVSHAQDVSLVGGMLTAESVVGRASSSTDGAEGSATGEARVTGLALADNELVVDQKGVHFADQDAELPGLPDDAQKALDQLGITVRLLPRDRKQKSGTGSLDAGGLRVTIESAVLRSELDALPLDELVGQIPDEAGDVRIALQTALGLAPKIVMTLGLAETTTAGSPAAEIPALPAPTVPGAGSASTGGSVPGSASSGGIGVAPGAASSGAAVASPTGEAAPAATGPSDDIALQSGLPKLYSIPGALLLIGLIAGSGLGLWLHRLGGLALGGLAPCAHGFASGTPNIRKVRPS